jgi:hypothetical protein
LISYFSKKDDVERRIYFAADNPIALLQDNKPMSLRTRPSAAIVAAVVREKVNLVAIFKSSLEF